MTAPSIARTHRIYGGGGIQAAPSIIFPFADRIRSEETAAGGLPYVRELRPAPDDGYCGAAKRFLLFKQSDVTATAANAILEFPSVFAPTVLRELLKTGIITAAGPGLKTPIIITQVVLGLASWYAQKYVREPRAERDPVMFAQGVFGESNEDWDRRADRDPDRTTRMLGYARHVNQFPTDWDVAANACQVVRSLVGTGELDAISSLADQIKVLFSFARDFGQLAISATTTGPNPTLGVSLEGMRSCAWAYGVFTAAGIFLRAALMHWLVPHADEAIKVLAGVSQAMSKHDAFRTMATAAVVAGLVAWIVETIDWQNLTSVEVKRAGQEQIWDVGIRDREHLDTGRMADQSISRIANSQANNGMPNMLAALKNRFFPDPATPTAQALDGLLIGFQIVLAVVTYDKPVAGWQGYAAVRSVVLEEKKPIAPSVPDIAAEEGIAPRPETHDEAMRQWVMTHGMTTDDETMTGAVPPPGLATQPSLQPPMSRPEGEHRPLPPDREVRTQRSWRQSVADWLAGRPVGSSGREGRPVPTVVIRAPSVPLPEDLATPLQPIELRDLESGERADVQSNPETIRVSSSPVRDPVRRTPPERDTGSSGDEHGGEY